LREAGKWELEGGVRCKRKHGRRVLAGQGGRFYNR